MWARDWRANTWTAGSRSWGWCRPRRGWSGSPRRGSRRCVPIWGGLDPTGADLGSLPLAGARVFHLAPPPGEGRKDPYTRRLVDAFAGQPRRMVYISTTGVYGDCRRA